MSQAHIDDKMAAIFAAIESWRLADIAHGRDAPETKAAWDVIYSSITDYGSEQYSEGSATAMSDDYGYE